ELLRAMATVARGEPWLDAESQPSLVNRMRKSAEPDPADLLTDRERSVLKLLTQGQRNRALARTIHLTEVNIKDYDSNILAKLKMVDRTQAALLAVRHGPDR